MADSPRPFDASILVRDGAADVDAVIVPETAVEPIVTLEQDPIDNMVKRIVNQHLTKWR
jgi:hypothetical protein